MNAVYKILSARLFNPNSSKFIDTAVRISFCLLFSFAITFNYTGTYHLNYLSLGMYALTSILTLYWCIVHKRFVIPHFWPLFAVFLIWIVIANIVNLGKVTHMTFTILMLYITSLIFYQFFSYHDNRKNIPQLFYIAFAFFYIILLIYYRHEILSLNISGRLDRFFGDPNVLGYTIVYGVILYLYGALFKKKYWLFACALFGCFLLLFTGSRSAILVCSISIAVTIGLRCGKKHFWVFLLTIIVGTAAGCGFLFLPFMEPLKERVMASLNVLFGKGANKDFSTALRLEFVSEGLNLFFNRPIFGYGDYRVFTKYSIDGNDTHNNFIELLVDYGFVAFLAFQSILLGLFHRSLKQKHDEDTKLVTSLLVAMFCIQFFYMNYSLKIDFLLLSFMLSFDQRKWITKTRYYI